MKLFALLTFLSVPAFAGTWTCDLGMGADGGAVYHMVVKGDAEGVLVQPAAMQVAGIPAGSYELYADPAAPDELSVSIIGYRDPRSKMRFRIMREEVRPNVFVAHTMLVNMQLKKELDGTCAYAP